MLNLILTRAQRQLKLLKQSCHKHSCLNLSKCLPNTGPWAERKWKEHGVWNFAFFLRWKPIRVKLEWFFPRYRKPMHYENTNIYRGSWGEDITPNVLFFGGYSCSACNRWVESQTFLESLPQELKISKVLVLNKLTATQHSFNLLNNSAQKITN